MRTDTGRHHILTVLVENKPGVLSRVAGLFSRRGFNIFSLAVSPTEDDRFSRTTIVELALTIVSGAIVAFALLRARGGRLDGGLTLAVFAALTALTAL